MAEKIQQIIVAIIGVFFTLCALMFIPFADGNEEILYLGYFSAAFAAAAWLGLFVRKRREKELKRLTESGIKLRAEFMHISGLQVSDYLPCLVNITNEEYKFVASNINFSLPRNKITDVCIKTKTEVQKQYVSSIGGAALGGALFGLAGAAYGGRATAKTLKNISNFLVITYYGENETDIKTIVFGISKNNNQPISKTAPLRGNMSTAKKVVKDFNNSTIKSENISIDL